MAQELKQSTVNTFTRGLVTEATPLTFPENASVDEENCTIERTGLRGRRKGIEFETGFSLSSFTFTKGTLVHNLTWDNVSGEAGVKFLVVQVGATLYFYDKSSTPVSGNEKSFSINLNTFTASNGKVPAEHRIAGDSINGNFVVVSPAIESFFIEYDPDLDSVTTTQINPKVRDFEWQGEVTGYDIRVSTASVTPERKYDTYNSGWINETAEGGKSVLFGVSGNPGYVTDKTAWPPLTHPWFSGKDANGNFKVGAWEKVFGGNSLIGNGRFILDLYSKDRSTASGVAGLSIETELARFSSVVGYAGRAWFAGLSSKKNGSRVFFTKVIENMSQIGNFYQEADPTSEEASDLIDSDGGVVNIPSASNIKALFEWGSSILVFAENGVWEISGVDGVFKATEFSVNRIREAGGILNSASLVDSEGSPFWWGLTGIFTVTRESVSQAATGVDLSKATIQTFWEAIPGDQRNDAIGKYDELNKRVFWLYGNDSIVRYKYNKVIILDIPLQALIPWEFEDESANTNYVVGADYFSGLGTVTSTDDVVSSGGVDDVVGSGGADDVVATSSSFSAAGDTEIKFLVRDGDTGSLSFATITNTGFLDWGTEDYLSFAETGYDFEDDLTVYKHGIYVTTYFNRTESGFTGNETTGYNPINPSSCLLKAFWDLRTAASSSQEAYRLLVPVIVDTGDLTTFNYPYSSIITRNRIRGKGRNLKLRFESTTGKDFQLQGYEVINAKNEGL